MDSIKDVMATQLTETEVMVFLLVREGQSYRDIAKLPFGFSYESARRIYDVAARKVQKMVEAGILEPTIVN